MSSFTTTLGYNLRLRSTSAYDFVYGYTSVYSLPQSETAYTTILSLGPTTGSVTPYQPYVVLTVPASTDSQPAPTSNPDSYTTTVTFSSVVVTDTFISTATPGQVEDGITLSSGTAETVSQAVVVLTSQVYTFSRDSTPYMTIVTPGPAPGPTTSPTTSQRRQLGVGAGAVIIPVPSKGDPLKATIEAARSVMSGYAQIVPTNKGTIGSNLIATLSPSTHSHTGLYAAIGVLAALLAISPIAVGLLGFKLRGKRARSNSKPQEAGGMAEPSG